MKKMSYFMLAVVMGGLSASAQTTLMSYNIKYANENDGENSWSQRKDYLLQQIAFYEPDIMGVQEALVEQLEFISEGLPDYKYVGVGREGGTKGEHSSIFYDATQVEVLQHDTFWLSETPDKISKGWDAALNRICTYGLFQDKDTGKKFYVFNTHFDHRGEVAREESAQLLLRKMEELNPEGLPALLMGDFNLLPESESIQKISKVLNDSKEVATEAVFGPEGTFNGYNFQKPVTKRIDYIFVTPEEVEVLKYAVLSDSRDLKYLSDHLPVFVKVNLK